MTNDALQKCTSPSKVSCPVRFLVSYLQYHKCGKIEDPRQREKQPDGVPERLQHVHEQAREKPRHPHREGTDVDGPDDPASGGGGVGVAAWLGPADDGGREVCGV